MNQTIYTNHLVYRRTQRWLDLNAAQKAEAVEQVNSVIKSYEGKVVLRGVYSTVGFRHDSDTVFWTLSDDVDQLQNFAVDLRKTLYGQTTEISWTFPGLTRPPEFVGDHYTAFQKGLPSKKYICLYPFIRTSDWYLMPSEERGKILREHGMMGREFPEVQTNNVQAFGIGDYEWVLAFECDQYERFVDLVRRLREAEARRYTKLDIPFIIGTSKGVADAISDLG